MSVSQTTTTGKSSFNVGAISAVLTVSGFFCMLNETVLNMALKSIWDNLEHQPSLPNGSVQAIC